jgi:hypothetical protein
MFKLNTSGFKIRGGRYYQSILFTNEERLHNANSRDLSLQDKYKSNNASVLNNFHLFYRLCDDGDSVCTNRVCNKDHKGLYCAGYNPSAV